MAGTPCIFQYLRAASVAVLFAVPLAHGQSSSTVNAPPQTMEDALHQMSDKAGIIFAGQVIAVRQQSGDGIASGFVEIQFRVDQAIRGCSAGTPYTLREWAGLWSGGAQRYRVGQRLLMFLHTPGASGLSSPIDGLDGAIPIHGGSSSLVATSSTQQFPTVDLRWIGAKLLRPISYRAESVHFDHRAAAQPLVHAQAKQVETADIPAVSLSASSTAAASAPAQQASIQTVIGMLQSWQKAPDAIR